MNGLPSHSLSPEKQRLRLFGLMEKQVRSYHRQRHMGQNTSVPVELARELLASMEYTVNQVGGLGTYPDAEEALRQGQLRLEEKQDRAKALLKLVWDTGPSWQTECRWEALRYLRRYLEQYDRVHLAHRGPEDLFYPAPILPPEELQGMARCLFFLNILWVENQIMAEVSESVLEDLWDRLPGGILNQCDQLLMNGIGKALLNTGLNPLTFAPEERAKLFHILREATEDTLRTAAERLSCWLNLREGNAREYVLAVLPRLRPWTGKHMEEKGLDNLFL